MKFLIVGLGNIGAEYELTRHNIGFLIIDRLAQLKGGQFTIKKLMYFTEVKHRGRTLLLIKPTTYMNLSGRAVQQALSSHKLSTDRLLVVTDDISLPFGKLRIKPKGSSGGHNGLKSIEDLIESQTYTRLRFGIGDDFHQGNQAQYVLSRFSKQEMKDLDDFIGRAVDAILSFCTLGINQTMNQYN